jgi:hypothetical protein
LSNAARKPTFEDLYVVETATGEMPNLGFLTVLHESNGYLGGYLVTNSWGRPLEFRVSTAVQPNRFHQILYGGTLQPYICADLIGKTLIEKTNMRAGLLVTDCESALELRAQIDAPMVWLPRDDALPPSPPAGTPVEFGPNLKRSVYCHPNHSRDAESVHETLGRLEGVLDLAEPFARIHTAIAEARKQGVASRG